MAAGRPKKADVPRAARAGRETTPAAGRGFAPGRPLADLPATARRILEAARRILTRDGFAGLTYEAIAAESGAYKDSIRYHFGGKAGLVAAVVDSSVHDASIDIFNVAAEAPALHDRIAVVVDASRELPQSDGAWSTWELLPHILRDDGLRVRMAELYEWYRQHYVEVFDAAGDPARVALATRYASILLAVIDGLAMQKALDPAGVDLDAVFDLWRQIVAASLDQLLPEAKASV